ncbi:uncharacterized protein Ecym_6264 [Eremothecium cymbalariae DBVPG|uniref:Vacuolar membrane protein n=1 Tax=Eremothecium cymbalariae (strain CBS 270.75 / DBVPG 7215 / KCTC 17166 / NRRL Y-17582) TaxID=931890 RepID=G8JVG7_ERECY|nr:hypothetical protein Ecym_6264 [Eremothecium cymbalariae DBVPG\
MPVQLLGRDQIAVAYEAPATGSSEGGFGHFERSWQDRFIEIFERFRRSRVFQVPIVHCILLTVWLVLLTKFWGVYGGIYKRSALLATYCSNILLFGLSDLLAQCISCVMASQIDPVPRVINNTAKNIMMHLQRRDPSESLFEDEEMDDEVDNVSVFNDYGPQRAAVGIYDPDDMGLDFGAEQAIQNFNLYRWACFVAWGWFMANFQVPWYIILNYLFTEDPTVVQVLERVLSDQLLYSPISLYCFFMYSNYIMERGDEKSFAKKIQRVYLSTLGCNYLVWPMVQFINFLLMPKPLQVPFSSAVGVVWNCFLSMRTAATQST